jgi:hypothetical protein
MTAPGPQPGRYQAIYRACMKEAAAQGRSLMQRLIARASESLPRSAAFEADEQKRRQLVEAARTLAKHEVTLCEAYSQALLAEFAQAIAGGARRRGTISFDALERMGDEQMRENVQLMRVQDGASTLAKAELAQLNALMSAVQGLASVQAERNPLSPEVYVRSLRTVTLQSPVPATVRWHWMLHLGGALGPELARFYGELAAWLRSQGVIEARAGEPASALAGAPHSASRLNMVELRQLLAGELDNGPATAPSQVLAPPAFAPTMPAALDALQNMKEVDRVVQRLKARQAVVGAEADAHEQARANAQALAQEVVNLMVDNIATDSRLLEPVQRCVRQLEPVLIRLARQDPRFFSDREHPARRLLDQLTQRSLAWDSATSPGFAAFIRPLQQAVEALRTMHVTGTRPFEIALKALEKAWGDARQRGGDERKHAVQVLLQAEQRNLLAAKIARGMRNRPDLADAPRQILAFITGPWTQVMAQARLLDTSGSADPGGFTSVITDLIWSAQPHVVGGQTARLLKIVPPLVEKLRRGLAAIDYPPKETQRFIDELTDAHRRALSGPAGIKPAAALPAMSRQELEAMMDGDSAWLAPSEARDSGFMESQPATEPGSLPLQAAGFLPTQPLDIAKLPDDLPLADLQPGAWVEMMTAQGWSRFEVTWASPHGTLFMFSGAGGQPHSMAKRTLVQMLGDGTLRLVVAGQGVVEGALDAVAQAALRKSVETKL